MGGVTIHIYFLRCTFFYWSIFSKVVSEYDQEIPQSQTADNPVAPQVSTHTDSIEALLQNFLSVESKFIPCYTVIKLQN